MRIHLHGADFVNKGGELMLRTTAHEVRRRVPSVTVCMEPSALDLPRRGPLCIHGVFPPSIGIRLRRRVQEKMLLWLSDRIPKRLLRMHSIAVRSEMDALLDISGYAFGDKWGISPLRQMERLSRFYRRRGKPVVLMPQMFGPFREEEGKVLMRKIANNCDLIYARDKSSFDILKSIGIEDRTLRMAPDITILSKASQEVYESIEMEGHCCLVPNARMLDKTEWGQQHAEFLIQVGQAAKQAGKPVVVLVHETAGKDMELAEDISKQIGEGVPVYTNEDPYVLKAYIGKAHMIVGARFHSLVAALSQGVPALAISWAHKYKELLRDFGVGEYCLESQEMLSAGAKLAEDCLQDQGVWKAAHDKLTTARKEMESKNSAMWCEICEVLKRAESGT